MLMRRHPHGRITSYADLDEEIDFLHSVIEKQQLSDLKSPKKQLKKPATINFQTDVNSSGTDSSKRPGKTQSRVSDEAQTTTTAAPLPAVSSPHSIPTPQPRVTHRAGPIAVPSSKKDNIFIIMVSLCVVVGSVVVILATVCFVKLQKESRLAEKVDYPAFKGASLPAATTNGTSVGDKTLAKSAQMYHYQHQKQQILSMGHNKPEQKAHDTDITSDEEEVGGDFTVYECPGLAPTGEMEVKNPLFDDSAMSYQGNQK